MKNKSPISGEKTGMDKFKDGAKDVGGKIADTSKKVGTAIGNAWSSGTDKIKSKFDDANMKDEKSPTKPQPPPRTPQHTQPPEKTNLFQKEEEKPKNNIFGGGIQGMQQRVVESTSKAIGKQVEKNVANSMNKEIDDKKGNLFGSKTTTTTQKPPEKAAPKKGGMMSNLFG